MHKKNSPIGYQFMESQQNVDGWWTASHYTNNIVGVLFLLGSQCQPRVVYIVIQIKQIIFLWFVYKQ